MAVIVTKNCFKLDSDHCSYIMKINEQGYLTHQYFGSRITDTDLSALYPICMCAFSPNPAGFKEGEFSADLCLQEYSGNGTGDFRINAIAALNQDGYNSLNLKFRKYEILNTKPDLCGLPSLYTGNDNVQTLRITLEDMVSGLAVSLDYCVFEAGDFFTRSVSVMNTSSHTLRLEKVMSLCLDFPEAEMDFLHLPGGWAAERQISRTSLQPGIQGFRSVRGTSSHQHNPVFCLCEPTTAETTGEAYGFALVYSGNHVTEIERTQNNTLRCLTGIEPDTFSWQLLPGEAFQAPEVVMVHSSEGLGGMSRRFHDLIRQHVCRGEWAHKRRPLLINNWEATYFDFSEEQLLAIAHQAADLGIELFVLDDGWFGHRNDAFSSLGDWYVNRHKLPDGLPSLAEKINALGMKFGLWFEPEMVSEDSDLFKAHPDWILHQPDRPSSTGRNQLVLDLSRAEVRTAVWDQIDAILRTTNVEYIKWDMNRHLTEAGSPALSFEQKGEIWHRYMLGVYELMGKLTKTYPHILLENCSGGGGRFDLGMLCYSPQIWTSDNTDAAERVRIQYGTSMIYPLCCMGSHVSAVPNHQTGRITPFQTRAQTALFGSFGYELDVTKLSSEEKLSIRDQIADWNKYTDLIREGDFYRLISPFDGNSAAWGVASKDRSQLLVYYAVISKQYQCRQILLKLPFADESKNYMDRSNGRVTGGSTLKYAGIYVPYHEGDYQSFIFYFSEVIISN